MRKSLAFALAMVAAAAAQAENPTPRINALLRVVKADGNTAIGQAAITAGGGAMATINVRQVDALVASGGRCAFNVKVDEVSNVALKGSVNRLYSNDTLIAQNGAIDTQPGVLKTIWTQPYLFPGQNNVKVVLDADGKSPTVGWVRVNVDGTCMPAPAVKPTAPTAPPAVPPVLPGSAAWNALYNAWGYSNYATTQLKGKGFAGYAGLAAVNADLTSVVNAKKVEQAAYDKLMARWNTIANDPVFKAMMAAVVPGKPGQK